MWKVWNFFIIHNLYIFACFTILMKWEVTAQSVHVLARELLDRHIGTLTTF